MVSNVGEAHYKTPVGLARLVEEEYNVQVVAAVTRTQRVEEANQLGPLTTVQMILVCKGFPIGASGAIVGSTAIPGINFSEWVGGIDSFTLEAGVNLWIGEDGSPTYARNSTVPAVPKGHFAGFSASLETLLGTAHASGLMASAPETVAVRDMAQRAARVGAALARAKLQQRVVAGEAQLREMGAFVDESEEEVDAKPAAAASAIDLIIEVQA